MRKIHSWQKHAHVVSLCTLYGNKLFAKWYETSSFRPITVSKLCSFAHFALSLTRLPIIFMLKRTLTFTCICTYVHTHIHLHALNDENGIPFKNFSATSTASHTATCESTALYCICPSVVLVAKPTIPATSPAAVVAAAAALTQHC